LDHSRLVVKPRPILVIQSHVTPLSIGAQTPLNHAIPTSFGSCGPRSPLPQLSPACPAMDVDPSAAAASITTFELSKAPKEEMNTAPAYLNVLPPPLYYVSFSPPSDSSTQAEWQTKSLVFCAEDYAANQMQCIATAMNLSPKLLAQRTAVVAHLKTALASVPLSELVLYGSVELELGWPHSDIDCSVNCHLTTNDFVRRVREMELHLMQITAQALQGSPSFGQLKKIVFAHCPILKATHIASGLHVVRTHRTPAANINQLIFTSFL
jgi:hypothetical protein